MRKLWWLNVGSTSSQAPSYASPKLSPTDSLTGVKCRATSVAKKRGRLQKCILEKGRSNIHIHIPHKRNISINHICIGKRRGWIHTKIKNIYDQFSWSLNNSVSKMQNSNLAFRELKSLGAKKFIKIHRIKTWPLINEFCWNWVQLTQPVTSIGIVLKWGLCLSFKKKTTSLN